MGTALETISAPKATIEAGQIFANFEEIFECTNKTFFEGQLTRPQFSFTRDPRVTAAFLRNRYQSIEGRSAHGIVVNSEYARSIGDPVCMSLIGFSIAQLARADLGPIGKNGKPGTPGYVDAWTRELLKSIGLQPFDPASEDRELGYGLSVDIIENGSFDLMCREMLVSGFTFHWHERPAVAGDENSETKATEQAPTKQTRARFQCNDCGTIAHSKPSAHLLCGCNGRALECTTEKGN